MFDGDRFLGSLVIVAISGSRISTGLSPRISYFSLMVLPITCSGGTPYNCSENCRMNSMPAADTM